MCGIAAAYNVENASKTVSLMLKALQHRGQEAAGIVSAHNNALHEHRGFGLADEAFARTVFETDLPGRAAIGHLRYATSGSTRSLAEVQPLTASTLRHGPVALAHNGNLTNDQVLRAELDRIGIIFRSGSDTEIFLHLLARSFGEEGYKRLLQVFGQVEGAYALLIMTPTALYAAVDPAGMRPLAMARLGDGFLFASETCAFDLFRDVREVTHILPGQLIELTSTHVRTHTFGRDSEVRHCSFEHIYFSRPDSNPFGTPVDSVRKRLGRALARKNHICTDVVIAVPDSSNAMALAYAQEAGIEFAFGLIRNHYTGRTFITPGQQNRELGVRMKLNAVRSVVEGRTVTVVDDSIVRGTTGKKVVALLREAGAREVHFRVGSPPVISPCYWGIDTPHRDQLRAANMTSDEICAFMGANSLIYLSVEELLAELDDPNSARYCTSCFTGQKPLADQLIPPEHLLHSSG